MLHIPQAPRSTDSYPCLRRLHTRLKPRCVVKKKKHFYFYFGHSRGHVLEIVTTKMKKRGKNSTLNLLFQIGRQKYTSNRSTLGAGFCTNAFFQQNRPIVCVTRRPKHEIKVLRPQPSHIRGYAYLSH